MSLYTALRPRRLLPVVAAALAAASLTGPLAGPASAKGGGDGGGDPVNNTVSFFDPSVFAPTPCQVKSFKTSSVTGIGDTAFSSISADYQVRPCDSRSTVTLDVLVFPTLDPGTILVDNENTALSGQVGIGVTVGVSYTIKLVIHDGATGAVIATASRTAAASRPTGV